jgi:hypothetical protein
VGAPGRDEHDRARAAAGDPCAGGGLPAAPVAGGPYLRLEGEQVEFAVEDVEQFFCRVVQVRADVEAPA